ncbi:MAG: hypothetical protein KDA91_06845 [Planctomycetaceae bacterium]|nr:hypothetical protein [Planctomycetaceae bacterium]
MSLNYPSDVRFRCSNAALLPVACTLVLVIAGCGTGDEVQSAAPDEQLMNDLLADFPNGDGMETGDGADLSGPDPGPASAGSGNRGSGIHSTVSSAGAAPPVQNGHGERLELRLQQGDRFPLIKTVEQHLIQKSEQFPATAHTKLELTLAITVEQVRADAVLMGVRYSRVNYSHDINGSRLEYDSAIHQSGYPRDAEPYAGMVNNGFSFWLGRDNKIRELVGYQEFLERCVQNVPVERRQAMLSEISNRFGDDGVANFVDDSIGLLPYDTSVDASAATRVARGDVWTRETRLMQPAPVYVTSTYRLVDLNSETAEIEITGRIASGESLPTSDKSMLKISGGHSMGKCTVDRSTGLPLDVTVTRFVNMMITLPDGQQVPQDKQIITQIRAFPETHGPVVQQSPAGGFQNGMQLPAGYQPLNNALQPPGGLQPGAVPSGGVQPAGFNPANAGHTTQIPGQYSQNPVQPAVWTTTPGQQPPVIPATGGSSPRLTPGTNGTTQSMQQPGSTTRATY